jgi:hypothetical protein
MGKMEIIEFTVNERKWKVGGKSKHTTDNLTV